ESPAVSVIEGLLAGGAKVKTYDPKAMPAARRILGERVVYCNKSYEAVEGADALVLATEWAEFREPDFARIKSLMRRPSLFDGRNIWNPGPLRTLGFHYEGIGRR
ncbi:MAG TPA: UDP-glucose/GDP-mannose dehydrogenase family protein, partial [Vicinamibacteria bacterium]